MMRIYLIPTSCVFTEEKNEKVLNCDPTVSTEKKLLVKKHSRSNAFAMEFEPRSLIRCLKGSTVQLQGTRLTFERIGQLMN